MHKLSISVFVYKNKIFLFKIFFFKFYSVHKALEKKLNALENGGGQLGGRKGNSKYEIIIIYVVFIQ